MYVFRKHLIPLSMVAFSIVPVVWNIDLLDIGQECQIETILYISLFIFLRLSCSYTTIGCVCLLTYTAPYHQCSSLSNVAS